MPYPELSGKISGDEMNLLRQAYCGEKSKMTLAMTYLYQFYILTDEHMRRLKEEVRGFLRSEFNSLCLIKEAIIFYGGSAAFFGSQTFWNAKWVNYETDVQTFLMDDLVMEKGCIAQLISISKSIKNQSLKNFLLKIVSDEELNLRLLENLVFRYEESSEK